MESETDKPTTAKGIKELNELLTESENLSRKYQYAKALKNLKGILDEDDVYTDKKELTAAATRLKERITKQFDLLKLRLTIIVLSLLAVCIVFTLHSLKIGYTGLIIDIETQGIRFELCQDNTIGASNFVSVILTDTALIETHADSIYILKNTSEGLSSKNITKIKPDPNLPIRFNDIEGNAIKISGDNLKLDYFNLFGEIPISYKTTSGNYTTITVLQDSNKTYGMFTTGPKSFIECNRCKIKLNDNREIIADQFIIYHSYKQMSFYNDRRSVGLALIFLPKTEFADVSENALPIRSIDFVESKTGVPTSQILNCTIEYTELNKKTLVLSKNDFLYLDDLKDFYLTNLSFGDTLKMRLIGKAGSIKTGAGSKQFSKMPSVLERITKSEQLDIIIAAITGLFTFLFGVVLKFRLLNE